MERTDHVFPAGSGSPAAAPAALRGRGAVTNVRHRFQQTDRAPADDGWAATHVPADALADPSWSADGVAEPSAPYIPITPEPVRQTTVAPEQARKLLSRNDSPDSPFDVAVNPYRGCEHGCVYCYARPTHAYLGYSPGLDFETRLVAKANAVELLRAELARPGYRPASVTLGSATDGYQPIERQWQLTRGVLQLLDETSHPVVIVTKNALVQRDIDILASMAQRSLAGVFFSITTLDADMARTLEPRASAPWRRLSAMQALSQAGVPVGVLVAPLIPFITDMQLEQVLAAAAQAGACTAGYTVLRLPHEVRQVFTEWLQANFPDRAQRVLHRIEELNGSRDATGAASSSRFGARMRGEGVWAQMLAQRFELARRKSGLQKRGFELDRSRFSAPVLNGQGQLF